MTQEKDAVIWRAERNNARHDVEPGGTEINPFSTQKRPEFSIDGVEGVERVLPHLLEAADVLLNHIPEHAPGRGPLAALIETTWGILSGEVEPVGGPSQRTLLLASSAVQISTALKKFSLAILTQGTRESDNGILGDEDDTQ